jgi:MFS family permease
MGSERIEVSQISIIVKAPDRKPAAIQGWTLVSTTWLSVIASAVIAPVLPSISEHFRDAPHVAVMVSFVATLPGLFVALLAAPSGALADRLGHRKMLLAGVSLYGFCGVAPFWLNSLGWIVISRAGVGIMEAVIMTCSNALIGDYFLGDEREKWLAYETGTATMVAILMVTIGGALGETGWRYPFLVYGFGFVLAPLVIRFTWETRSPSGSNVEEESRHPRDGEFRWNKLIWICLITVFASTAFYVVIVQLSFLLTERGYRSPRLIGMGAGISALAVPLGAVLFRILRWRIAAKLALSFSLSAAGLFILAFSHSYSVTILGATVNGLGSGIVLPALITWALSTLGPEVRGRGTGAWQASFFFGQFISPLIILTLAHSFGSLSHAVLSYAIACSVACSIALFSLRPLGRAPSSAQHHPTVPNRPL